MISHSNPSSLGVSSPPPSMTDAEIASKYLGIDHIPCLAVSPLRNDRNPSMSFFYTDDGTVLWKDFGTGESGGLLRLLGLLWNMNIGQVVTAINEGYGIPYRLRYKKRYKSKAKDGRTYLKVRTRDWNEDDMRYWSQYGIGLGMLEKSNVFPISHYFVWRDKEVPIIADRLSYAYFEWKDGHESIKVYQPMSTTAKWLSNRDSSVWDLWEQAMKWEDKSKLIITSSRKDAMCLWCNLGIPAICMQGEGYRPKDSVMKTILSIFSEVYVWYDTDKAGIEHARMICEAYPQIKNVCIPAYYGAKDPSDFVKKYGVHYLNQIFKSS